MEKPTPDLKAATKVPAAVGWVVCLLGLNLALDLVAIGLVARVVTVVTVVVVAVSAVWGAYGGREYLRRSRLLGMRPRTAWVVLGAAVAAAAAGAVLMGMIIRAWT
jgi:hypothetical protein